MPLAKKKRAQHRPAAGMGAVVCPDGVTFRIWAPNADAVSIIGDFNTWIAERDFLEKEDKGNWAIHLPKATIGNAYTYVIHNNGRKWIRKDPYALEMDGQKNSIVSVPKFDWRENGFQIPDRNALILYQVHVGTFFGGYDENSGRFEQVCEKIRYLKALGINALELVPVSDSPKAEHWGYDPAYPFAIEKAYGGPKVLADLVDTAHRHNIAVIMQVNCAHFDTSSGGLWQFDGQPENNMGGSYFYNDDRARTPWGNARPDYGKQEVRGYIRDYVFMWLETYRCDGIRIADSNFVRNTNGARRDGEELEDGLRLIKEINGEIRARFPQKLLIAEDLQGKQFITRPISDGGLGFDAQWDARFMNAVRNMLRQTHDEDRCLSTVAEALEYSSEDQFFDRIIYCEYQNAVANGFLRLPVEINPKNNDCPNARKKAALGAVLLLTAPGIPMLFQGQEFMDNSYFLEDRDPDWVTHSNCGGILKLFADLIRFRKSHRPSYGGLRGGGIHFTHFNQGDQILAYTRFHEDRPNFKVLVVLNFSKKKYREYSIGLPCKGRWKLVFNSNSREYDPGFSNVLVCDFEAEERNHDNSPCSGTFSLPEYTALIFIKYATD
ncbi:MAG TPA: alpha-amylase family glycosyl hydrolase [Pricia sp.]|nr:alpha-amylase family glycosyl hydrolase [Pricia sp.]